MDDFSKALFHTLSAQKEYAIDIFHQIDNTNLGYITFGMFLGNIVLIITIILNIPEKFRSFAEKKAEFAGLFSLSKEEKFKPRNGDLTCPSDYNKKLH